MGAQTLLMLRVLRLLRIFRIFRLSHFLKDINFLVHAMYNSIRKISIFMLFAVVLVMVFGSFMYLIEKHEDGFASIPDCIYWAIVTMTTVGYGDVVPHSAVGKALASIIMLIGYAIVAVPMGIISSEMANALKEKELEKTKTCNNCNRPGHEPGALFCKFCGDRF